MAEILVKVNGEDRRVPPGATLAGLLESLGLNPGRLACELNMEIVKRADYEKTKLKDGDTIEIVQMIGGE
jgi:thiamine biosynthesis protein ThiS